MPAGKCGLVVEVFGEYFEMGDQVMGLRFGGYGGTLNPVGSAGRTLNPKPYGISKAGRKHGNTI